MRPILTLGFVICALSAGGLGADQDSVPAHPSQLKFPERQIQLPSAENRRFQFENGPVVYLAEDHTLPLVDLTLALPVGSFLDPPDQIGLAYLTGSQIRRGGAGSLDATQFDDLVDDLGSRLNTLAGTTRSGATLSVPSWALDEGLDLLFAMLIEPQFQQDRLDTARSNLVESMTRRNEDALEVLEREWEWLMYGEEHFSNRPMTPTSLQGLGRQELMDLHRRCWRPGQMILAVSGDFDAESLLSNLESRFALWPVIEPAAAATPVWPPPAPRPSATPGLFHYEMDVPQAKVMMGHRLPSLLDWTDTDRFVLTVLAEILGGQGAISRIAGRLRTAEGLVYRASAQLLLGDLWPGELRIFFDTQSRSVSRAVELAAAEVERLRTEPIHPKELDLVKQSLLARLRLDFDTAEEIAGYFAEDELLGRPHSYWQNYLEGVSSVTVNDVRVAAKTYLQPSEFTILVVGRWSEIAAGQTPGTSDLERVIGRPVGHLPARDPLSLKALSTD